MKILTRKNAEETGDQWLTEEDTKSFRELLISLLVTPCCHSAAAAEHLQANGVFLLAAVEMVTPQRSLVS